VFHPLQDAFWGERHGQLLDPFGHRWGLAQKIEDVAPDEVARRAAALFDTDGARGR
jgi:PhnB protein